MENVNNLDETWHGDPTSRTTFLVRQQAQFLAFLERRLGNRAEAEDMLQTAYIKALTEIESVREDDKVLAWFYRLLRNLLADRQRHQAATARLQERLIRETPVVTETDEALYRTVCQCVLDLTQLLKPEYREVLQRVELEETSLGQVAEALRITPNNVSVRLHRARRALHTILVQMCGTCAEHGCLDCACQRTVMPRTRSSDASSGSPV
jgi:RNA polymerase sigma-70 factor (ECF subfamily)